jgi:hypothetical protein
VAALAVLIVASACAGPLQGGRESLGNPEEIFVRQTVQSMAEALEAGDADRLLAKVSDGYYRGFAALERRVRALVSARRDVAIKAEVETASFDGPRVTVAVRWSASWVNRASGARESAGGNDRLVFMKGLGLKLIDQTGETLLGF